MTPEDLQRAWLLGGTDGVPPDDYKSIGAPRGAAGLLSRMLQAFPGDPIDSEQIALSSAAVSHLNPPDSAMSAVISVNATSCRVRFSGKQPTATVGVLIGVGTIIAVTGVPSLKGALFIGTAAGSILDVDYFG